MSKIVIKNADDADLDNMICTPEDTPEGSPTTDKEDNEGRYKNSNKNFFAAAA